MKKLIILLINNYLLFIGIAFSQSGWILQSPLPTNFQINTIKYISSNTAIALAGPNPDTWEGLKLKTTNNGISWNVIDNMTKIMLWDLFFLNENTGYAVGDSTVIMKTTNGGNSWIKLHSTNSNSYNTSVFFLNENTGYVYNDSDRVLKTTNGGINWIYLNIGQQVSNFANIFFVNENTGFIPLGYYCLRTTNGGYSWNQYTINMEMPSNKIYFLNESTGFAIGSSCIISKTTNGGINWILTPPVGSTAILYSIMFINNNTGFAAGGNAVLKTTNNGNIWSVYFSPSHSIRSIDFTDENTGLTVDGGGEITKTTNAGDNWDLISSGTWRDIYAVAFSDLNNGYSFAMQGEILRTTNGGTNWVKLNPYGGPYYFYPYFVNSDIGIARTYNGISKTTNGGINWIEKLNISTNDRGLFFLNHSLGFASGNGFYKTIDTGETWTQCSQMNRNVSHIFFINALTGFAAGGGQDVIKTTDGGYNWFSIDTIGNGMVTGIAFPDSVNGYISFNFNYSYISKTTNSGLTWTKKTYSNIFDINSICFINKNTGFLTTNYVNYSTSIKRTTNGGDNWINVNNVPYDITSIVFPDSNIGYAIGKGGIILKTTDGGSVWVSNNTQEVPKDFILFQNYPNPFNPNTIIRFQIKDSRFVTLKVYDVLGKEVKTLVNEKKSAGIYEVSFNGSSLPSGIYFYKLQSDDFMQVKKMVLIK